MGGMSLTGSATKTNDMYWDSIAGNRDGVVPEYGGKLGWLSL